MPVLASSLLPLVGLVGKPFEWPVQLPGLYYLLDHHWPLVQGRHLQPQQFAAEILAGASGYEPLLV